MSFPKLRGAIREKFGTQEAFACAMGMHPTTLSSKLQSRVDWTRKEMERVGSLLGIPKEELMSYFF